MLKSDFQSQTGSNGHATSISHGLIATVRGTPLPAACKSVTAPSGANSSNTFVKAASVGGKCGYALRATSIAVHPSPRSASAGSANLSCGEYALVVNADQTNKAVQTADDACSHCKTNAPHIDDFLSANTQCFAVGNYTAWTANNQGQSQ